MSELEVKFFTIRVLRSDINLLLTIDIKTGSNVNINNPKVMERQVLCTMYIY